MAKAYIANRPVRFDRNYKVGEVIPDRVISPNMGRKLTEMGRILCVDLPDTGVNVELPQDGADEVNTQAEIADAPEGESNVLEGSQEAAGTNVNSIEDGKDTSVPATGEFVCEVCGRAFKSSNALSAHSRAHKE